MKILRLLLPLSLLLFYRAAAQAPEAARGCLCCSCSGCLWRRGTTDGGCNVLPALPVHFFFQSLD